MKVTISSQSLVQNIMCIFNRFEDTAKLQATTLVPLIFLSLFLEITVVGLTLLVVYDVSVVLKGNKQARSCIVHPVESCI